MSELKVGIMKRLLTTAVPGPDRCALAVGATRPGCRRVAFAKVGVVYTAADIEELSARLIATTGPAAAHQLHELDTALAQLREQ